MTDRMLVAAFDAVASEWAGKGGPATEYTIAVSGGELLGVAEMEVTRKWDDDGRRAALGALARATECETFAYIADATVTVDGAPSDALVGLELVVVDMAAKTVGARTHIAQYRRTKKRFGADRIEMQPFSPLESSEFGAFVEALTATWALAGDQGRLGAVNVMSETGITLSDLSPTVRAELDAAMARVDG